MMGYVWFWLFTRSEYIRTTQLLKYLYYTNLGTSELCSINLLVHQKYLQLLSALMWFKRDTSASAASCEVRTFTTVILRSALV
jgi:hypothetical protein